MYLVCRDPRTPWYSRTVAIVIAGCLFSPIDLIPDWIPLFGYLDDMLIVPFGIMLVIKITPKSIVEDCRARAETTLNAGIPINRTAAVCIIVLWLAFGAMLTGWLLHRDVHH